jgi:cytochrome c oxidase cbb3-type subunit III
LVITDGIAPEMPGNPFLSDQEVASAAAFVRSLGKLPQDPVPGDPARGGAVYARSGCSNCHIVEGRGFAYGPALSDVGERRSVAYLRQAIVRPESALPEGFLLVRVTTARGKVVEGIRINEDSFTLQIRGSSGEFHSFRKQNLRKIDKLRGKTPMPPYETILDRAALDDLVSYLAAQRGSR